MRLRDEILYNGETLEMSGWCHRRRKGVSLEKWESKENVLEGKVCVGSQDLHNGLDGSGKTSVRLEDGRNP